MRVAAEGHENTQAIDETDVSSVPEKFPECKTDERMNPTLIVIPTLDPEQGADTGHRAQLSAGCDTRLVVIHDYFKKGFTKTVNQGLRQRWSDEDVCILNDDIQMFNYGWLRALQNALYAREELGIVGPSGDCASSTRAGRLGDTGLVEINTLPFWCVLIRREAIDQVGYLDEAFIHYSSDTWWCLKAKRAGWERAWLRPLYLWHEHQASGFQHEWRTHDSEAFKRRLMELV